MVPLERQGPKPIEPFLQGECDNLCGLYAIVNAIRLAALPVKPLTYAQAIKLFEYGLKYLQNRRLLHRVIIGGMEPRLWLSLARWLCHHASNSQVSFTVTLLRNPAKLENLVSAKEWVEQALLFRMPVLILLERQDHYSVVSGISETQLHLFDSWSFHRTSVSILDDAVKVIAASLMRIEACSKVVSRR